jgi:hypothetical protein
LKNQEMTSMTMRLKWCSCVAAMVLLTPYAQAEDHRPSQRTLEEMGLSGLVVMTDDDASKIRGRGYMGGNGSSASAFGNSFATIDTPLGGAHSENSYTAEGERFAKGANFSEAGVEIKLPGGGHGGKDWGRNGGPRWPGKGGHGWGGRPGMGSHHHGGGHGGGHNGGGSTIRLRFFAGGFSFAKAH